MDDKKPANLPLEILVVEDNPMHMNAAKSLLSGHNVTAVGSFDAAISVLKREYVGGAELYAPQRFDVVLTDLLYTQGRGIMMSPANAHRASEEMAFGFPLAMIAARQGVKHVAIVTDMCHHDHPMAYTFDFFKDGDGEVAPLTIDGAKVMLFDVRRLPEAYVLKDGTVTEKKPDCKPWDYKGDEYQLKPTPGQPEYPQYVTAKNWKAALEALRRTGQEEV